MFALVCAGAACAPAVLAPKTTFLCGWIHPDCLGNHWLMVWVAEQVAHGRSLLHNDRYYWPIGDAPWLAGNGNEGFAFLPWYALFGWPMATTVHLVLVLALNGIAGWALCRAAGVSRVASLAAVPTSALMIYTIQELGAGRFSQVSICWIGFFLASWLRFLDSPTTRRAALAAVLLAVTSFFYWYYGFFAVLAGLVLWLFKRTPVRPLLVFCGVFLGLIAPLLYVFWAHQSLIPGVDETFPNAEVPGDSCFPGIPFLVNKGRHAGRALPFTTVALALFGLRRDRLTAALVAVWLLFAGLMAGPLIPHGPYEQIYGLAGPLRRFWWPYRHVVVLNFVWILLAARGTERLLGKWPKLSLFLAITIPVQTELLHAPWHALTTVADVPNAFYRDLRSNPGTILVEPPLAGEVASSQAPLVYQLDHRKKLLGGHALWVDRVRPDDWDAFVDGNTFLAEMRRLERGKLPEGRFTFAAADLQSLIDAGATLYVVNFEYFPGALDGIPKAYVQVFEELFGRPIGKGHRAFAYDAANWKGTTEASFTPFAWPEWVRPGGPSLAIQLPRLPSMSLSMGGPKPPPPPKPPPGKAPGQQNPAPAR